jgi:hypothetical protein
MLCYLRPAQKLLLYEREEQKFPHDKSEYHLAIIDCRQIHKAKFHNVQDRKFQQYRFLAEKMQAYIRRYFCVNYLFKI